MLIKLLDKDLIRRFNKTVINVDSGIGRSLIEKFKAVEVVEKKMVDKPLEDKMIKNSNMNKTIFPENIIGES